MGKRRVIERTGSLDDREKRKDREKSKSLRGTNMNVEGGKN